MYTFTRLKAHLVSATVATMKTILRVMYRKARQVGPRETTSNSFTLTTDKEWEILPKGNLHSSIMSCQI